MPLNGETDQETATPIKKKRRRNCNVVKLDLKWLLHGTLNIIVWCINVQNMLSS